MLITSGKELNPWEASDLGYCLRSSVVSDHRKSEAVVTDVMAESGSLRRIEIVRSLSTKARWQCFTARSKMGTVVVPKVGVIVGVLLYCQWWKKLKNL